MCREDPYGLQIAHAMPPSPAQTTQAHPSQFRNASDFLSSLDVAFAKETKEGLGEEKFSKRSACVLRCGKLQRALFGTLRTRLPLQGSVPRVPMPFMHFYTPQRSWAHRSHEIFPIWLPVANGKKSEKKNNNEKFITLKYKEFNVPITYT